MKNINEVVAKKLIIEEERKIAAKQKLILSQEKALGKLKNLRYIAEDKKKDLEAANDRILAR